MSGTVMPRAAISSRDSQTRMANRRSPEMMTLATPSISEKRSLSWRSMKSVSSRAERRSLTTATQMMARASASTLAMIGVLTLSGRSSRARATLSRTSLAADSMSRPSWNSMVISERSSRLTELMVLIASMPATADSSGSVTWFSTTSADAPV